MASVDSSPRLHQSAREPTGTTTAKQRQREIPGPRAPNAWQFARWATDPVGYAEACQARYGSVFALRLFLFGRVVFSSEPQDAQAILSDSERFEGGEISRQFIEPVVGASSVLTSTGEAHMRQRKLLLPPLHADLVERWSKRIESIAEAQLKRLPLGKPVAMRPTCNRSRSR